MKLHKMVLLGAAICASALAGCGGGGDMDAGTDVPTDMGGGNDAATDAPVGPADSGNCFVETRGDNMPWCPARITNTAAAPNFLITQIDLTRPASLAATGPVGRLLNTGLVNGTALWGISLDVMGAAGTIRTGSLSRMGVMPGLGTGLLTAQFRYIMGEAPMPGDANRWNAVMGTITLTGETFTTNMIDSITIPIFDETNGSLLAELPLRNAIMRNVRMTSDRNCIGQARAAYSSCLTGRWITNDMTAGPAGVIEGDMTAEAARGVNIPSLMTNLCNVIAGSDCAMVPPAMWRNQTDTMVNGMPAWHLLGNFTGVGVNITR